MTCSSDSGLNVAAQDDIHEPRNADGVVSLLAPGCFGFYHRPTSCHLDEPNGLYAFKWAPTAQCARGHGGLLADGAREKRRRTSTHMNMNAAPPAADYRQAVERRRWGRTTSQQCAQDEAGCW